MKYLIKIISLLLFNFLTIQESKVIAQLDTTPIDSSTIKRNNTHSVKKAVLYSTVLPGLGQIYNRKIWKLPFLYGGFALAYYYYDSYTDEFRKWQKKLDADEGDAKLQAYDVKALDFWQRNRQFQLIVIAGIYLLNIIDASVDAHFFKFDVSDDLSMKIQPTLMHTYSKETSLGLSLSFSLK